MIFFFLALVFSGPPPSYLTKLGRPTPGVAQKKLMTYPPTKTSNVDVDRYIREHWLTTFVRISKKSSRSKCEWMKENKAQARKRRRERAEENCERVFSAISHSSSYGEVITSDHCSWIGLNILTKRDGRWF